MDIFHHGIRDDLAHAVSGHHYGDLFHKRDAARVHRVLEYILCFLACFFIFEIGCNNDDLFFAVRFDLDHFARDRRDECGVAWHATLKDLLNARQTVCYVATCRRSTAC